MLRRIVAWLCIIAHLNLIIPSFHMAYAGTIEDLTEEGGIKVHQIITSSINANLEGPFPEEHQIKAHPSLFTATDVWEEATSTASAFWKTGIPLLFLASLFDSANPFSYLLGYLGLFTFLDNLDKASVIKQTARGAQAVYKFIDPSQSIIKTFLVLFPFLFHVTRAVQQTLKINGGENRDIPYLNLQEWIYYDPSTIPFLKEFDPNKPIMTTIGINILNPHVFGITTEENWEHDLVTRGANALMRDCPGEICLYGNMSVWKYLPNTILIRSTLDDLKNYLLKTRIPLASPLSIEHRFRFFNGPTAGPNDFDLLIGHATRKFYHLYTYNDLWNCNLLISGVGGLGAAVILCCIVACWLKERKTNLTPLPEENSKDDTAIEMIEDEEYSDYKTTLKILEKMTDSEVRQNLALSVIQTLKDSLKSQELFHLGSYIEQTNPNYEEVVKIQTDCFDQVLKEELKDSLDTFFKSSFDDRLKSLEKNSERRQDIAWHYIQKYEDDIKAKGDQVLFEMSTLIEGTHPKYAETFPLQAKALKEILKKESDEKVSLNTYLNKIDILLKSLPDLNRSQDLIFELIVASDLPHEVKEELCDRIQSNHPQYKRARIEKAHLIHSDTKVSIEDGLDEGMPTFDKVMSILITLPDDENAKVFRKTFLEECWTAYVGEDLPEVFKNFDPKTENDLMIFKRDLKQQDKLKEFEMLRQGSINSLNSILQRKEEHGKLQQNMTESL
jgi:hypothetical protein